MVVDIPYDTCMNIKACFSRFLYNLESHFAVFKLIIGWNAAISGNTSS